MKNVFKVALVASVVALSGCAVMAGSNSGKGNQNVLVGPGVTSNPSPYSAALVCTSLTAPFDKTVSIAVGNFPDLTGKYSFEDGGYKVTQGAQMMAQTALGYFDQVQGVERIDVGINSYELDMANKRILGDGRITKVRDPKTGKMVRVNYRILGSGSMAGSDYFITGGITEINYNIFSGGWEAGIENIGGGLRKMVLNVAADARLVDTRSLRIVKAVTLQKQVIGYETKAGIFRFFGSTLFDLNAGEKTFEPIQLAVRSIIEAATNDLVGGVIGGKSGDCLKRAEAYYNGAGYARDRMMRSPRIVGNELASQVLSGAPMPKEPVVEPMEVIETKSDNSDAEKWFYLGDENG